MATQTWRERFAELHPRRFFGDTWAAADARARAAQEARIVAGLGTDFRPFAALALATCVLTFLRYGGTTGAFAEWVDEAALTDPEWAQIRSSELFALYSKMWWSGTRVLGYFVIPAIFVRTVMKQRVADQHLRLKGFSEHVWIYGVAFVFVAVLVFAVSFDESFQNKYPMYEHAGRSWRHLLEWELMYAAQFFALEFFFRGFWMKSLEPVMGGHAVTAMTVPYAMIHFGKPWPEAVAAIIAGLVLGTLVLKYRSIWAGFLVHVSVALSMDFASLIQKGGLPDAW